MSPAARIEAACVEFDQVGSEDVARSIRHHLALGRRTDGGVTEYRCGCILQVIVGENTSNARSVVKAVSDSLLGIG